MKRLIYALLVIAGFGMFLRDGLPILMKAVDAGDIPSLLLYLSFVTPLAAIGVYRLLVWQVPTTQPEFLLSPPLKATAFQREVAVTALAKFEKENAALSEFVGKLGFDVAKVVEQMSDSTNVVCKNLSLHALRVERDFTDTMFSAAGVDAANQWLDSLRRA